MQKSIGSQGAVPGAKLTGAHHQKQLKFKLASCGKWNDLFRVYRWH